MNKIYKVIWSKVKGAYIVVSELAKGYTRAKTSKRIFSGILASSVITLMISAGIFVTAPANVFAGAAEVFGGSSHEVGKFYYYYDESDGHYIILNNKYLRSDGAGGYTYTVGNKVYSTKDSTLLEYIPGEYKDDDSVIVGGQGNSVYARRSGIFAGLNNRLMGSASESAIIGGWSNSMGYSHDDDLVSVSNSVILGGSRNFIPSGHESSIIGGENNTLSGHGVIVGSDNSLLVNGSGGSYSGYAAILGGENGYASYNSISIGGGYAAKGMAIGEYASNNEDNTISFGHKIGDKFLNTVVTSNVGGNGSITDENGNVVPMDGALRTVPKGHTYTANLRGDTYTLKAGDSYICFGNSSYLYIHDTYDDEQTKILLENLEKLTVEDTKYKVAIILTIFTGVRLGELMGLEWQDVDFRNGIISINRSSQYLSDMGVFTKVPKTESSIREIAIPEFIISLLEEYKLWYEEQKSLYGELWTNSDRLFVQADGKPMHPSSISKWFVKYVGTIGLPVINFHGLRHTNASLLVAQNVDIAVVSARLGHAQISTTLDFYVHPLLSHNRKAGYALENLLLPTRS